MNNIYLGGLYDIAAGFTVTAQNVPAAQANMLLAKPITMISFLITIVGLAFMYIIPAQFIVKGLFAATGLGGLLKKGSGGMGGGMGGSGGGGPMMGYLRSNFPDFLVACLFALNACSGLWASELSLLSTGVASCIQKVINASWSTADSPASIKQFRDDVKVYSAAQCAQMYESYLRKEETSKQQLTRYVENNHPDANDENYQRMKADYTAIVCRLQILSEKLQSANYAKDEGISDPNFYKRHLEQDQATSNSPGYYNPNFIVGSMANAFQVQLPGAN